MIVLQKTLIFRQLEGTLTFRQKMSEVRRCCQIFVVLPYRNLSDPVVVPVGYIQNVGFGIVQQPHRPVK